MSNAKNDYVQLCAFDLEILREKIAILNKKAKKLGCEPAKVKILDEVVVNRSKVMPGGNVIKYEVTVFNVTVVGSTPKLAGWSLVAKVEYIGGEKLIKCVPGETCPIHYRDPHTGLFCDHCKSRRERKNVFVLRHDDGRHVQVGRQCIEAFLGGKSPEQLLAEAAWGFQVSGALGGAADGWGGGDHDDAINMVEYLNSVAICIRRLGWVSKAKAAQYTDSSTSADAWYLLRPFISNEDDRKKFNRWVEKHDLIHQARDEKLAAEALEWAKAISTDGSNDYMYNLGVACRAGFILRSTAGIVASLISTYLRHMDREEEIKQRRRENRKREWLGEVKVRQDFEKLTIIKMISIPSRWNDCTTLVIFEDETGNIIKWFASVQLDDLEPGDVVNLKATVKKHDEYNEQKQTLVTRAKILEKVA